DMGAFEFVVNPVRADQRRQNLPCVALPFDSNRGTDDAIEGRSRSGSRARKEQVVTPTLRIMEKGRVSKGFDCSDGRTSVPAVHVVLVISRNGLPQVTPLNQTIVSGASFQRGPRGENALLEGEISLSSAPRGSEI